MKKIIIANWKMNPQSLAGFQRLARIYANLPRIGAGIEIVITPPFIYLSELLKIKNLKLKIGAQNVFWATGGAYTGEISPKMLKDLGVDYVIIGHSERREYVAETDEMINKKVKAVLSGGLKAVLCVGEPLEVQKKGKKIAMNFIKNQLQNDLKSVFSLPINQLNNKLIIAYEPVWSISTSGTGLVCSSNDALEMIKFIKLFAARRWSLKPKILYGGSVDSKNVQGFLRYDEIDGALVGGASVNAKEFKKIVELTNQLK